MTTPNIMNQPWFNRNTLLLLTYLSSVCDEEFHVFMSQRQLSAMLKLSRQEVRSAMGKLIDFGIVNQAATHQQPIITLYQSISYSVKKNTINPPTPQKQPKKERKADKEEKSPPNILYITPTKEEINKESGLKEVRNINISSTEKGSGTSFAGSFSGENSQGAAPKVEDHLNEKKNMGQEPEATNGNARAFHLIREAEGQKTDIDYAKLTDFVNKTFEDTPGCRLPRITGIKDGTQRRTWVRARIQEYGKSALVQVIRQAAKSEFLNGRTVNHPKPFDFDWIVRPNNFVKVLEGNYNR